MTTSEKKIPRIVVVGAGISGLAAAIELNELSKQHKHPIELILLESSYHAGGIISSVQKNECLLELGPDAIFTQKPAGIEFCKKIGLESEIIETNPQNRASFVAFQDQLIPVPEGFYLLAPSRILPLIFSPLFSWLGKLRILWELFIPKKRLEESQDESIASFVKRRFGQETLDRIAQPMVSGIYSADPYELSLKATFPKFIELEQQYGSVIKGLWANRKQFNLDSAQGPRYNLFISLKRGLSSLAEKAAEKVSNDLIKFGIEVREIRLSKDPSSKKFKVCGQHFEISADAVCLALPAWLSSKLLKPVDSQLSNTLDKIRYGSGIAVNMVYKKHDIKHPLKGFGFVVPALERKVISGVTFSSIKFPGRAPEDHVILRAFIGGSSADSWIKSDDQKIESAVRAELKKILQISAHPVLTTVTRHPRSLPQYRVGHLEWVKKVEHGVENIKGLALAGNSFYGTGIPDCIETGTKAAQKIFRDLI